ncbi:glycosyltransferase [Thiohalobacter sp.]|uniref:glycosyltransferase n=1 Tax=Thiohalobacter sp. TaxID=2025948 RepID=UPI002609062A|nr:glycosyltransferase [Thiohalobacter sp.]
MDQTGTSRRFAAVPNKANARVYVPFEEGRDLAQDLRMYEPGGYPGKLFKVAMVIAPRPFQKYLLSRSIVGEDLSARLSRISRIIGEILPPEHELGSVYQGTPGPREKLTIQVSDKGRIIGYVKIAERPEAAALIKTERRVLRELAQQSLQRAIVPSVAEYRDDENLTWLYQLVPQAVTPELSPRPLDIIGLVEELSQRHRKRCEADQALVSRWPAYYTQEEKALFSGVREAVERWSGPEGVLTHFGHGDFAPWNIRRVGDGRLYVYDWEYGSPELPALFDFYHFVVAPLLLVEKQEPAAVAAALLRENGSLHYLAARAAAVCGVDVAQLPLYLSIYLWGMIDRGVVVDEKSGIRLETQLARISSFRRMLQYILAGYIGNNGTNVLVSAYACEPNRGSEPGVGWNMVRTITSASRALVVTRKRNQPVIEAYIRDHPIKNAYFLYVDLPRWLTFWKRGSRGIRTYYYLWQFAALVASLRARQAFEWRLAHHVTFVNDWLFTFLCLLPGKFVWGPIGAHPRIPPGLARGGLQAAKDIARVSFQAVMRYLDPLYWLSAYRCALVIGVSEEVFRRGPLRWVSAARKRVHTAIGLEEEFLERYGRDKTRRMHSGKSLDIVAAGRLIPVKGFHLAVEGFAKYLDRGGQGHLEIIGRGREGVHLVRLAESLGVAQEVRFTEWMDRDAVIERLSSADVFLYPSFESGGIVILEAMGLGLPVITSCVGGPGEFVAEGCGVSISPCNREKFTDLIAEALLRLSRNVELRVAMGSNARERVRECYLWEGRGEIVEQWYSGIK